MYMDSRGCMVRAMWVSIVRSFENIVIIENINARGCLLLSCKNESNYEAVNQYSGIDRINISTYLALASLTLILGRAISSRSRWLLKANVRPTQNYLYQRRSLLHQPPQLQLWHRLLMRPWIHGEIWCGRACVEWPRIRKNTVKES